MVATIIIMKSIVPVLLQTSAINVKPHASFQNLYYASRHNYTPKGWYKLSW